MVTQVCCEPLRERPQTPRECGSPFRTVSSLGPRAAGSVADTERQPSALSPTQVSDESSGTGDIVRMDLPRGDVIRWSRKMVLGLLVYEAEVELRGQAGSDNRLW